MRILKKGLNITFINPNTENDEKIKFDYSNLNSFQNSHRIKENELEL